MRTHSRLRTVKVIGANPLPAKPAKAKAKSSTVVATATVEVKAQKTKISAAKPAVKATETNPLAVRKGARGAKALQADLTRYYEECLREPAARRYSGQRRKAYCAGVAHKRAKASGRHAGYYEEAMHRNAKGQFVKGNPRSHKRSHKKRTHHRAAHNPLTAAQKRSLGRTKTGQFKSKRRAPGHKPTMAEAFAHRGPATKPRKRSHSRKKKSAARRGVRSLSYRSRRGGRVETITIRRNPMGMVGTVVSAVVVGGIGYGIADLVDRWYATRAGRTTGDGVVHTDPLTGLDAATAIAEFSWARVGISAGVAAAGVVGGMVLVKHKGMLRTMLLSFGLGAGVKAGADLLSKYLVPMLLGTGEFGQRYFPVEVASYQAQIAPGYKPVSGAHRAVGCAECGGDENKCGCGYRRIAQRVAQMEAKPTGVGGAPALPPPGATDMLGDLINMRDRQRQTAHTR